LQSRGLSVYPGADWLQGPYVYSLYREQYGLSERMVAILFVTGFMSAGLTAPLVGVWADQQYVIYTFPTLKTFDFLLLIIAGVKSSVWPSA